MESLKPKFKRVDESKFHQALERFKRANKGAQVVYEDDWGSKLVICPHMFSKKRVVICIQPAESAVEIPISEFDEFLESLRKALERFREVMENEKVSEGR